MDHHAAAVEDAIHLRVPVGPPGLDGLQHLAGGGAVERLLGGGQRIGQRQQAAGDQRPGAAVRHKGFGGHPEIRRGQPIPGRQRRDAIVGAALGGVPVGLVTQVLVGERKAVQRPALAPGPTGPLAPALAAQPAQKFAGGGVKARNVVAAAVGAQQAAQRRIGVAAGHRLVLGVAGLPGGPAQQRNVEHTVHDHPAGHVLGPGVLVPGADEAAPGVEPPHQVPGGPQPGGAGLGVAGEPVLGHAAGQKQKAHVVVQRLGLVQHRRDAGIRAAGGLGVGILAGGLGHLPQDARPEPVGPPGGAAGHQAVPVPSLHRDKGQVAAGAGTLGLEFAL